MKSPPPPPVDRIERTVNPVALAILLVCLAGALLAVWLAPSAIGATLLTWMIVILAICGAFGLLLYAFGLLQPSARAARFDTTKAIANSNPEGVLVTDHRIAYRLRQRCLSRALGRCRSNRSSTDRTSVHRLPGRLGIRLSAVAGGEIRRAGERGASSFAAAKRPGRGRLVPYSRSSARGPRQETA